MDSTRRVDKPERKLEGAKAHKGIILAAEKRINELKEAIKETKFEFVKDQYRKELRLMEKWLGDYKKDPSKTHFDEFAPLYETSS